MIRNTTYLTLLTGLLLHLFSHVAYCQIITTVAAGTNAGDGGSALQAAFDGPASLGFDKKGNTFIVDTDDHKIRKIDANGIITTLAGDGKPGFTGDGGPALSARFIYPYSIATDDAGNVYIADSQNSRIRKVDTNGTITTIAGTGTAGFNGDGGPAVTAQLNYPHCVITDKKGNLYIVDQSNHRIRKISPNGVISTVAGNGADGFAGDGGLAINAQLQYPSAIALDAANNLYIADTYNKRIRKVEAATGLMSTVAGNGGYQFAGDGGPATAAPLNYPVDIAVATDGTLYIAQQDSRVRKVTTNGIILPVAGSSTAGFGGDGGPAVNAQIGAAVGVRLDTAGNVYIADRDNYRIRRITPDGIINTLYGGFTGDGGDATKAFFRKLIIDIPANLAVDAYGNIYVSDRFSERIRKVSPAGIITTAVGNGINGYAGDGGPATSAQLSRPRGVGLDSAGNLYMVDQYNSRIRKVDQNKVITTVAGNGTYNFVGYTPFLSSAEEYNSGGMAVSKSGTAYVPAKNCILKITTAGIISIVAGLTASGGYSGDGGPATNAQLNQPTSVALDAVGNLYIADFFNNRVRKVDTNGIISTVVGNGSPGYGGENIPATGSPLNGPYDVVFNAGGAMYVSESGYSRVRKVDSNGIITTVTGNGTSGFSGDGALATNARLASPNGLAVDAAGNLYIADTGNERVRKVTYPIQPTLAASGPLTCAAASVTLTASPAGAGFTYQFSAGATQIGMTNQAVVSTAGSYSVTVSTSFFGSPAGSVALTVSAASVSLYTIKPGNWNDPAVWVCGTIPMVGQPVRVLHLIDIPPNYQAEVRSIRYENGGRLRFSAGASVRLAP